MLAEGAWSPQCRPHAIPLVVDRTPEPAPARRKPRPYTKRVDEATGAEAWLQSYYHGCRR